MLMKAAEFFKGEISGWKWYEVLWNTAAVAAILLISISDTPLNIVAAVTGVSYTLLAGKGKISCYGFGIVNSILYGWASYEATLYGDAMLNWGYYLPMMFVGIYMWLRRRNAQANVIKAKLTTRERFITAAVTIAAVLAYGILLKFLGDAQPFVDSTTTVLSITATWLTVRRCVEQWILWMIVNAVSIFMWLRVYLENGNSLALLCMWCIFLAAGIIFFFQWYREILTPEGRE